MRLEAKMAAHYCGADVKVSEVLLDRNAKVFRVRRCQCLSKSQYLASVLRLVQPYMEIQARPPGERGL